MKNICLTLICSLLIPNVVEAAPRGSSVRSAGGKRARSGSNFARSASMKNSSSELSSTSTDIEEKDAKTCEEIFYSCMDQKTNEVVMQNDIIYNEKDILKQAIKNSECFDIGFYLNNNIIPRLYMVGELLAYAIEVL